MIESWSHSKVVEFEKCKYRAFLLHDQKVQEPQRPLPAGKTEHANDRGTRVHEGCELFIKGELPTLPPEASKFFQTELEELRDLYKDGMVSVEGEWGMARDWAPWNWRGQWVDVSDQKSLIITSSAKVLPAFGRSGDVVKVGKKVYAWVPPWLRLKLDALVFISKHRAIAIDFKTGKRFGNELKHGEQLQLYQLVTFLRYPELEEVTTELWYLDVDDLEPKTFTRDQGLRFMKNWERRGNAVTTAVDFPPNPNKYSCRWCMYGPWGSGHCEKGVR